jgi:putative NIF3 family GTP cyclohydrolase 1 type 2
MAAMNEVPPLTARRIVDRMLDAAGATPPESTVDTFKAGDPEAPVTGVAVTFMATMAVLRAAVERHHNFVITHEPTFYLHLDELDGRREDPVIAAKLRLIDEAGLVVYRFHDLPHRMRPDLIVEGMVRAIGWTDVEDRPVRTSIHPTTVGQLAAALRQRLGGRVARIVGDAEMACHRPALAVGSPGTKTHLRALADPTVDVLIVGECHEWETVEYVRDAAAQGRSLAMIVLGHRNSEEAGMQRVADWLRPLVPEVPVEHLPAEDPFTPA